MDAEAEAALADVEAAFAAYNSGDMETWAQWRERLNNWSGGLDTYTEIHKVAREIPADMLPENVEPRRWWRTA